MGDFGRAFTIGFGLFLGIALLLFLSYLLFVDPHNADSACIVPVFVVFLSLFGGAIAGKWLGRGAEGKAPALLCLLATPMLYFDTVVAMFFRDSLLPREPEMAWLYILVPFLLCYLTTSVGYREARKELDSVDEG